MYYYPYATLGPARHIAQAAWASHSAQWIG